VHSGLLLFMGRESIFASQAAAGFADGRSAFILLIVGLPRQVALELPAEIGSFSSFTRDAPAAPANLESRGSRM
jgi:hypothetical protein